MKTKICFLVFICAVTLSACGETSSSNTIRIAGSTSMEKLSNTMAESFMIDNPDVLITTEFIGSSSGIESVQNKTVNIGNSSRALTEKEKSGGAFENIVALDGIAVIMNNSTACNLTFEELKKIYSGEIKNLKELGKSDIGIVVIGREAGSGTRDAFESLLGVKNKCKYANELDSTGAVLAKVSATEGSVGYVSLDVLNDSVTAIELNNVEPSEENIRNGTYPLSRPFIMATNGKISEQDALTQKFFKYINSDKGQKIIKKVGLVTVK